MAALGPFEDRPNIAVGVSGGRDSMALLHLLREWVQDHAGQVIALTVDHGLRPEAAHEAEQVAAWCGMLGCTHVILRWSDPPIDGMAIQELARKARYRLLGEACAARGILHLAVAHHGDDQAETLLLRLGQGSGPDGLAGMAPIAELAHARLIRPVLPFPAEALKATCIARNQAWLDDPGNASDRFTRARLRGDRALLTRHNLDSASLGRTAARMAATRAMLEQATASFLAYHGAVTAEGVATLDIAAFRRQPAEMQQRILGELTRAVGGLEYRPRSAALQAVCAAIEQPCFKRTTLGHCLIARRKHLLKVEREARSDALPVLHAAAKGIFAIV